MDFGSGYVPSNGQGTFDINPALPTHVGVTTL